MATGISYPATGFHFRVEFELFPQSEIDVRFQEVSGLTVTVGVEEYAEGGQNRFTHKLPMRTSYNDVVLKRGLFTGSGVINWCRDAVENYNFKPTNVLISLLNDKHEPLRSWYLVNAYPKSWEVSSFNAEQSQVVIETLTLTYNFFKVITNV
jgi:phage tail-like protein